MTLDFWTKSQDAEIARLRAEVARLTREAEWEHRGWDNAREHADRHEKEAEELRTHITQLRAALQALADAADARLHDPNWIPLLNARRVLAAREER